MSFFVTSVSPEAALIRDALRQGVATSCYRLEYANHFWADSSWQLHQRMLPTFHTVFCAEGHAGYEIEDVHVNLRAGTLLVVGPGVAHGGRGMGPTKSHLITARFVQEYQHGETEAAKAAGLASIEHPLWWAITVQSVARYEGFFIAMAKSWQLNNNPLLESSANMLLNVILYESITELTREEMGDSLIAETVQYIDEHPQTNLTNVDLAKRAGISPRSFSERFRDATGKSPAQYRIHCRAQAASKLLIDSDLSIKEIAFSLGYPDQFAFSRQFKTIYGVSPSRFRQERFSGNTEASDARIS
jgi:AraC-like DNA-binding protein/mannose-6-phosphate isomerase-like protein (cupin superfamily)